MEERVNINKVKKLREQRIKKNETVDTIDALDKGAGRIFSKIGKYFLKDFWK